MKKTPRDVYDDIVKRYMYINLRNMPEDKAKKLANIAAVKYTWIEFTIMNEIDKC